jgi:diguanylate cyclase (GGDEF)-like protein
MTENSGEDQKTQVIQIESDTLIKEKEKAKDQPHCLLVIRGKKQGGRINITKPHTILGRDPSADIVVEDPNVSRKHCEFFINGDEVIIKDNNSTNGTFVNEKKITQLTLRKEDMIRVGNSIFKFLPKGELEIFYILAQESKAHTDALTQVFNKGHILEAFETEFKRARALGQDFSIIIMDLDHFKKINDTHGHDAGDYVLKEAAQIVKKRILPQSAIMGRFGGEEFIILLPSTPLDEALIIAESIRSGLEKHNFQYENTKIPVTASIGVAEIAADVDTAQDLFKLADKAVYQAKQSGRNRVCKQP